MTLKQCIRFEMYVSSSTTIKSRLHKYKLCVNVVFHWSQGIAINTVDRGS